MSGSRWCPACKTYHRDGEACPDPIQREKDRRTPTVHGGKYLKIDTNERMRRIDESLARMDARWGWLDRIFGL